MLNSATGGEKTESQACLQVLEHVYIETLRNIGRLDPRGLAEMVDEMASATESALADGGKGAVFGDVLTRWPRPEEPMRPDVLRYLLSVLGKIQRTN